LSLANRDYLSRSPHTFAGKTGTTQNWHDAWTIGFSPQITTAIWFGFDTGGHSLGTLNTGASVAAPVWAQFMAEIHKNLPVKYFERPPGLINVSVCKVSGKLPSKYCPAEDIRDDLFISGTQPTTVCDVHKFRLDRTLATLDKLQSDFNLHEQLDPSDVLHDLMPEDYPPDSPPPSLDNTNFDDQSPDNHKPDSGKPKPHAEATPPPTDDEGNYLLSDD
jgi:penicillin-binding protein 1A